MPDTTGYDPGGVAHRLAGPLAIAGAVGAAVVSAVILVQTSAPDAHIRGCGGGGCAGAWASKWSTLFGVPVAAGAALVYLSMLVLLCIPGGNAFSKRPVIRANGLLLLASIALLSILYFAGIQVFILHQVCKWCLAAHAFGLIAVVGVLMQRPWAPEVGEYCFARPRPVAAILLGVGAFAAFAAAQAVDPGPATHKIVEAPPTETPPATTPAPSTESDLEPIDPHRQSEPARLRLPDGSWVEPGQFPTIGPVDAERVVFKLYDYTCDACRDIHNDLEEVWPGLDGDAALVLIPCPLNRDCHPGLPRSIENHRYACELAEIALAVWYAAPDRFHDYHRWAFANRPRPDAAQAYAATLAPDVDWETARSDPRIDEDIAMAADLFAYAGGPRMPKLHLPDGRVVVGVTRDTNETRRILRDALRR